MTLRAARDLTLNGAAFRAGEVIDPEPIGSLRERLLLFGFAVTGSPSATFHKSWRCQECDRGFRNRRGLRVHRHRSHPEED